MNATDYKMIRLAKLQDIAFVQPGYLNRKSVRSLPTGTHRLLQARDVSPNHGLCLDKIIRFKPERNPDLYRVSRGDILLAARGQDRQAYLVEMDLSDVLASNVFYIIRPREDMVLPGFLAWYLNQHDVQASLGSASHGTGIGYISRPSVEQLSVVIPPLNMQRRIAEAMNLWKRQRSIQEILNQKREQLLQVICRQAVGLEKE